MSPLFSSSFFFSRRKRIWGRVGAGLGASGVSWPSLKMSLKFKKKGLLNRDRLRLGLFSCARISDDWEACPTMRQKGFGWWRSGLQARYWKVHAVEEWRWGDGGGRGLEDSKMSPWRVIVNRWKKFACFPKRVRLVLACARFYNDKIERTLLFVINAWQFVCCSLEFHNKNDNQTNEHNKGKSKQIKSNGVKRRKIS